MKFEPGKTYPTRSGEEALIYAVDAPGSFPIHGRLGDYAVMWMADGRVANGVECPQDIAPPAPERVSRIVYANVWPKGVDVYRSEGAARLHANPGIAEPLRIAVPCRLEEVE